MPMRMLRLRITATPIRRIEGDKSVSENDIIFAIQGLRLQKMISFSLTGKSSAPPRRAATMRGLTDKDIDAIRCAVNGDDSTYARDQGAAPVESKAEAIRRALETLCVNVSAAPPADPAEVAQFIEMFLALSPGSRTRVLLTQTLVQVKELKSAVSAPTAALAAAPTDIPAAAPTDTPPAALAAAPTDTPPAALVAAPPAALAAAPTAASLSTNEKII